MIDALLERDAAAIRAAIHDFRQSHSLDDLFAEVTRFAVLAYAPSQHGKHAVIACRSALEVGLSDAILAECAIYAAASRQPWSEPPINEPPEAADDGGIDELRAAVADDDRLRGERWLAKRLDDAVPDLLLAASDDFEDLGHKLIVAVTASKLASLFPAAARFATLRIAVWEMTSYRGERYEEQGVALDAETLLARLVDELIAEEGNIVSAHAIFLLDAALESGNDHVLRRVRDYLTAYGPASGGADRGHRVAPVLTPYRLARDYGALLNMHAVARRLGPRFPDLHFDAAIAAAEYNLAHAASFEEFSFA